MASMLRLLVNLSGFLNILPNMCSAQWAYSVVILRMGWFSGIILITNMVKQKFY